MSPKPRLDPLGIPLNIPRDRDVLVDRQNHPVTTGGPTPTKAGSDLFLVSTSNHRLQPVNDSKGHTVRFDEKDASGTTLTRGYQGAATVQGADPRNRTQPSGVPLDLRNSQLTGSVSGTPVRLYDAQQRPMQTLPDSTFTVHGGQLLGGPARPGATPPYYQVRDNGRLTAATGTDASGNLQPVSTGTDGTVNGRLLEPGTERDTGIFGTRSNSSRVPGGDRPGGERTAAPSSNRPVDGSYTAPGRQQEQGLGSRPIRSAGDVNSPRQREGHQAEGPSLPRERSHVPPPSEFRGR